MIGKHSIGVAIPCYMSGKQAIKTVQQTLKFADYIVAIDDACPINTGKLIKSYVNSEKLYIIYNKVNQGVGGATKLGFDWLMKNNCDIILKIDSDGQMNPADIPKMCEPIIKQRCEATKGNRFTNLDKISRIPKIRLIGNIALSFITKLSTGYWELFDPTNGFIVFRKDVLERINLSKTDNRYFFETDLLFRCALKNIYIKNIEIDPIYNNVHSSVNPIKEFPNFFIKHIKLIFKRIFYQYIVLDFNPGSIELILSVFAGFYAIFLGLISVYKSNSTGILTSAGTVSLFTISMIICVQLLVSFLYYDCTIRLLFRQNK